MITNNFVPQSVSLPSISLIFINSIMRAHHSNIDPFYYLRLCYFILFYFTKNTRSTLIWVHSPPKKKTLIWVMNLVRISINHMMLKGDTFTKICLCFSFFWIRKYVYLDACIIIIPCWFFFLIVWSGTTNRRVLSVFDFNFLIEMYMCSYFFFLVYLRFGAFLASYNYQSAFHIF